MTPLTKNRRLTRWLWAPLAVIAVALFAWHSSFAQEEPVKIPAPRNDVALAAQSSEATAVLAGGCFWGMQGVFEHVKGVKQVLSGYSGGTVVNPGYEQVSSGSTGHAESIQIKYDPSQVSYGTLLQVYFSVAHNPTELNYQGPDEGTQYRSAIFYSSDEQKQVAQAYIAQLNAANAFPSKIVTETTAFTAFYPAEDYHQDYLIHHPDSMYITFNDLPKIDNLKQMFPELYRDKPVMVSSN
jgi:peptide-methionine (S)-S-oxide reductase